MKKKCTCRPPKSHEDCAYCGTNSSDKICGICKENGIDGPVIKGTERIVCKEHKRNK